MTSPPQLRLGPLSDFPPGEATPIKVDGQTYVVVRHPDDPERVCVVSDRCPHLGFSLTKGPGGKNYADGVITCPFHNSRFDVCSGDNLDWTPGFAGRTAPRWSRKLIAMGRKPAPLTTFEASIQGGDVVVHRSATAG